MGLASLSCEAHDHALTVLLVVGGLLALLAVACWREARSGKPEWGAHLRSSAPTTGDASKAGKSGLAATLGTGAFIGYVGDSDG